jgi:DNA-binding transcriptional regulator YiaG
MEAREFTSLDWKSARIRAALTQSEAARLLGISQSQLSRFELGERTLSKGMEEQLLKLIIERQMEK